MGWAYEQKGRFEQAVEEFEKARALSAGSPLIIGDLGYCYALWGRKDKAQELLGELLDLSERRYVSPVNIAVIHFGLGSKAEGFRWLERAYEERDCRLVWLKEYPTYERLRRDPRFVSLVRKLGLEC